MANNKLLLFGTELKPTFSEAGKGVAFLDDLWEAATENNAKIRETGFVPGTAASSVALNTALRQASFGAKIIGDILSTDAIPELSDNEDVSAESDLLARSEYFSNKLINYLQKLNQLIDGSLTASRCYEARNYVTGGGIDNAIKNLENKYNTLATTNSTNYTGLTIALNTFISNIQKGTEVVHTAQNYASSGTINSKIKEFQNTLTNLESVLSTYTIVSSSQISVALADFATIDKLYYSGGRIFGSIKIALNTIKTNTQYTIIQVASKLFTKPIVSSNMSPALSIIGKVHNYNYTVSMEVELQGIGNSTDGYGFKLIIKPALSPYDIIEQTLHLVIDRYTTYCSLASEQ